jgi:hypothetical protein
LGAKLERKKIVTDEVKDTNLNGNEQEPTKEDHPPAEAQKTEHMIPKTRLDEEIQKRKDAEARATALEAEKNSQLETQLAEQGKYKELAEERNNKIAELQPKADKLEEYEKTLLDVLESQIKEIPEEFRGMVPEALSTQQKLNWIAANKSKLMKSQPFDIGAGKRGGTDGKPTLELTEEEKATAKRFGVPLDEYAKFKNMEIKEEIKE